MMNLNQISVSIKYSGDISNIKDKFDKLFPSWPVMLATLLALLILMLVMGKLLYKPIKKMIKERKQFIQDNIDASVLEKQKAIEALKLANEEVSKARHRGDDIIEKARRISDNINEKARRDSFVISEKIIREANLEIKNLKEDFKEESKKEIIENAILISKKIIGSNMSKKIDSKYIDSLLKAEKNAK